MTARRPALTARSQQLHLARTFSIARSSIDVQEVCVVELKHDGIVARGEGSPVDYQGETAGSMVEALRAEGAGLLGDDPWAIEQISIRLRSWDGPRGAKMALDGALHDWFGKRLGQPLWRLFGLDPLTPPTSYTIGLDTFEGTIARVAEASRFLALKVKVGGPADLERLEAVRARTGVPIRIDGNEGWTLDTARELLPHLIRLGVEFIEQPFPARDRESFTAYREIAPRLPVLVDEGCGDLSDLAGIATYADGVVIKLCKSGGIREALRMIPAARALGLRIMLGCMIESELGISQAAQLGSLVDYVDLDGHLLIRDSPFTGLGFESGRLVLPEAPGLGVWPAGPA